MTTVLPGSKTPGLLQQLHWAFDPVGYLESNQQKYPDLFLANVAGWKQPILFVSHPQALQYILTNDRKQLSAPKKTNEIVRPLVGDYSILLLEGQRHQQRRQLLAPPFHGERMYSYGESICQITHKVLSELPLNKPFSARQVTQSITMQVILEVVFGLYEGERYQQLKKLLSKMLDIFNSPIASALLLFPALQLDLGTWSPWNKFLRQREQIDHLLYQEIAERRANPNPEATDILSLLMSVRYEDGQPLSDQELRDELMTLLMAGHDTTATAMAWGLYWIHHLPHVKEKLLQELATLKEKPDPMEIVRLPYLSAVCNETLRITPVAMLALPRVVQEPLEILGYALEPGTAIFGCMFLTHRRSDLYPDPKQFKPERFLERKYSPYEFIPFGGGTRRCVGDALAPFELKLVLASIVSGYDLSLADTRPEKLQRRGLTLGPARGVLMILKGQRTLEKPSENLVTV
ncbi:cytochrome P450 [Gloeothece verrucosa]|uniref:Cytochrome P450 n=1 Tax=Gloeothece verrucosa (strain PCC 7822) TaxID=497965 RepID=E0UA57_GLOV7|nr:cytochrome P450 [Gloeothece verrucosa]ADN16249.1 cytochrome P450 [Gloeothece verrucosa PCC 7822]